MSRSNYPNISVQGRAWEVCVYEFSLKLHFDRTKDFPSRSINISWLTHLWFFFCERKKSFPSATGNTIPAQKYVPRIKPQNWIYE